MNLIVAGLLAVISSAAPSPYAGQEDRPIKALSEQEVADYLAGKGMGLAKAAELNRYPGPAHVLELAAELGLTADQRARTQRLFEGMQREAARLGRELVTEEQALDRAFATAEITTELLEEKLGRIGRLQAAIRKTHLGAHLEQVRILTAAQVASYVRLRGYGHHGGGAGDGHVPGHRH